MRYRIVGNEKKSSLTGKKSFCKEAEKIYFPSGKKQLFVLENI